MQAVDIVRDKKGIHMTVTTYPSKFRAFFGAKPISKTYHSNDFAIIWRDDEGYRVGVFLESDLEEMYKRQNFLKKHYGEILS